jgi:hypothetical protein
MPISKPIFELKEWLKNRALQLAALLQFTEMKLDTEQAEKLVPRMKNPLIGICTV